VGEADAKDECFSLDAGPGHVPKSVSPEESRPMNIDELDADTTIGKALAKQDAPSRATDSYPDAREIAKGIEASADAYSNEYGVAGWGIYGDVPMLEEQAQLTELAKHGREEHYAATPWEWEDALFDDEPEDEE
jgi:hypothetical protein